MIWIHSAQFLDMNNNISHHGTAMALCSYIVQVEMHLKELTIAYVMLQSNHIEIIFFENYNDSLHFMEMHVEGGEKGWKYLSSATIFLIDSRTISTFSILQCEMIGFCPFIFFLFPPVSDTSHTLTKRYELVACTKCFQWINSIFLWVFRDK